MLNKMDSAGQGGKKLITGIVIAAIVSLAISLIGTDVQNMAQAIAIRLPLMAALFAVTGFFALRLVKKMEKDRFEEGMRLVLDNTPMVCSMMDPKGNVVYCNDEAPKLVGLKTKQEYFEKLLTDLMLEFQPDGRRSAEVVGQNLKTAFEKGRSVLEFWQGSAQKGKAIPCVVTLASVSVYGENRMLVFSKDMSEAHEIKKQEETFKERMQAIMDSTPLLCALYDGDGIVLEVNKEAERLFDIPDRHIFANNFNDFIPYRQPDGSITSQKAIDTLRQTLRDGYMRYEFMYQRRDGTPIPTEEIMSRVTVNGKHLVISYSRDLREFYASKEKDALVQQNIQTMMEQLNVNVSEQAAAVTESAAAIEEMVANIQSVTNALTKNAEQVTELQSASEVGHKGINEVVADIRGIAAESESLLEINSVMANIASQTNLLSMNAAIEAAHAGEAGRGFAVVADEIRKLAESSSTQSKTISLVLKTIKGSIDKITRSAENVLNRFDTIDGGIKTVAEQERGVLNAMEEQKQGSGQVLQAIGQVSDITQRVKNDAQQMVKRQQAVVQ